MLQIILIIPALVIGFVVWTFTAILSGGVLGRTGAMEALIFFAPILGLVAPLAVRCMAKGAAAIGVWMLALAPLAGALNFALAVAIAVKWPGPGAGSDEPDNILIVLLNCAWFLPLIVIFWNAAKAGNNSPRPIQDPDAGNCLAITPTSA